MLSVGTVVVTLRALHGADYVQFNSQLLIVITAAGTPDLDRPYRLTSTTALFRFGGSLNPTSSARCSSVSVGGFPPRGTAQL